MFCDLYNIAFQKEEIEDESKHSNTPCTAKGLRKFFQMESAPLWKSFENENNRKEEKIYKEIKSMFKL